MVLRRVGAAGVLGAAAVAVCAPLSTVAFGAVPSAGVSTSAFAGYTTSSAAADVSASVTVPTVSCGAAKAGATVGQSGGVALTSGRVHVSAGIRVYCQGKTAKYVAELDTPDGGTESVLTSGLDLKPGRVAQVEVSVTKGSSFAQVSSTVGNTGIGVAAGGSALRGATASIGSGPIRATGKGSATLLPGPVASSPIRFGAVRIGGKPFATAKGLTAISWRSTATGHKVVAEPSAIAHQNAFSITFTP